MPAPITRKLAAEFLGTSLLVCAVVGSGIMAERLSGGNTALALLANTIATAAALVALIFTFGSVSGAHFNPAVTLAGYLDGEFKIRETLFYIAAQITGGVLGVAIANLMFGYSYLFAATTRRNGIGIWVGEFIATFGLLSVVFGSSRVKDASVVPFTVAAWIAAAYWFTSSTSFANPAVTIARSFSDTFTGICPYDVPAFILIQLAAAVAATYFCRWLFPRTEHDIVVPHE